MCFHSTYVSSLLRSIHISKLVLLIVLVAFRMKRRELVLDLYRLCSNCNSATQLHSLTIKSGFVQDTLIAAKLSKCYAKYATHEATYKLFDEMLQPTVYIWNSVLKCCCRENLYVETLELFCNMIPVEKPDQATISIALNACSGSRELNYGRVIHGIVKKNYEMDSDLFVGSALIDMYSKGGLMDESLKVFDEYPKPDIVMWTHIVKGYHQNGDSELAFGFFSRMLMEGHVSPDSVTLVCVLSASSQLPNAMTAMLFSKMKERDVISWASMVSCYAHNGLADDAINLFNEMMCKRVEPNPVSVISALQACEATCNFEEGKKIHEIAARKGFELDVFVSTALIDMYMNCSLPDEAIKLFEKMPKKDALSWMALLSGCVQNGMAYKSMELFVNMLADEIQPDIILMVKMLTTCSQLGVLQHALCLHSYIIKYGFENDSFIEASLIESYSKCGSLDNAIKVFNVISDKDVVIWSSMIAGYGIHGHGREALELFNFMVNISRTKPNNVTFVSVLSACSHAGLIKEGMQVFNIMLNEYQITPESNHYAILVDLFGRMGEVDKAISVINDMHVPVGPQVWGALLGACRIHHNTKLGEIAANNMFLSDSSHAGYFILLSNIHAVNRDWDNVEKFRTIINRHNLTKVHGQSAIEVKSEVHSFMANDRFHPQFETIHRILRSLEVIMREEGYVC